MHSVYAHRLRRFSLKIATMTVLLFCGLGSGLALAELAPESRDRAMRLSTLPESERRLFAAIYTSYRTEIDSVRFRNDDALFYVNHDSLYFAGGRMLSANQMRCFLDFAPLVYPYQRGKMLTLPGQGDLTKRSSWFFNLLYGRSEKAVRSHCREVQFLGRFVFLNKRCIPALRQVERQLLSLAKHSKEVRAYIESIEVAYSFKRKTVVGASHASLHSFGLALDLVPRDYNGKHVYWKWSRVFHEVDWQEIPLRHRWHPPQAVIDIFEENGFIWGGKWSHFDTIHFEYRPEILAVAGGGG